MLPQEFFFLKLDALRLLLRPFCGRSRAVATWLAEYFIPIFRLSMYAFGLRISTREGTKFRSGVWKTRINGSADHGLRCKSELESRPLLTTFSCSLTCLFTLLGGKNLVQQICRLLRRSFVGCQLRHAGIDNSKARCNLEHACTGNFDSKFERGTFFSSYS